MSGATQAAGLLGSVRALGATLLEMAGTRLELAVLELREEGERRMAIVALQAAAAIFLAIGLLLAALFVVALFWDTHRLAAIAAMSLLYLGMALAVFARAAAKRRAGPPPFEATQRELAADLEVLRGAHEQQ